MQSDLDDVDRFTEEFLKRLQFGQGVALARATKNDLYFALARTVRQQLMSRWLETLSTQMQAKAKAVAYLSAEYLLGRQLDNALLASGLTETAEKSMAVLGHRPGHAARRRGRAGPGQRRPRPAGRLLHRLAGHHADPGGRLRHPLRVRHLPADLRRRRAGRAARLLAGQRLAVGVPAPGDAASRSASPGTPSSTRTRTASPGRRWKHGWEVSGDPVQLHGPRLPHRQRQHPAAVERPGHPGLRPAGVQHRRLPAGGPGAGLRREHQQGALPGGLHPAGQGTAAAAAVLLRRLLAARLHRQHPAARTSTCAGCRSG